VETDALTVTTAFSGWFTSGDAPGQALPNWKQAMIVLLTLFPVVI
jgi:antibiotic biosynthesis monooxygenase (ABM) superfamily enzyme